MLLRTASGISTAIFAANVRKPLNTFHSVIGVFPPAISTIIVSPTARPRPIISAENKPLIAVGITIRHVVCQGVAPQPSDPDRR